MPPSCAGSLPSLQIPRENLQRLTPQQQWDLVAERAQQ